VIHSLGGFTTESARISHEFTINAYLMANVAGGDILHLRNGEEAVDMFGSSDLVVSAGFLDHLSVGLDVPFHFGTGTFLDGKDLADFTVGDIRLSLKATAVKPYRIGGGIGLAVDLLVPSGSRGGYGREAGVVVMPKIVLDAITENIHLMTNLWVMGRSGEFHPDETTIQFPSNLDIGSEAGANVALAIFLGSTDFRMLVEGRFESRLTRFFEPENTQLEFTWGLHWKHSSGFAVGGGASFGVLNGYGDPDWRGFLTIGYQPARLIPMEQPVTDRDKDGIPDQLDQCPDDPEDFDNFDDGDGCPDLDNDKDGIPDTKDKCPDQPEDMDGVDDEDGCPDPDNDRDRDGILDSVDKCPTQPEDMDGFEDQDGCPDPDNDKDGIPDATDKCPNQPEDLDGVEDDDGCPDLDNDKDGIPDATDKCPNQPEDLDGFQDDDGCPDPDNDKDGILDGADKCPLLPETVNGCNDEDGCPDDAKICVTKEKISIADKIFFKTGKADILPKSYPLLAALAKVINENPQIELIEIQGHTDTQGKAAFNLTLSDNRANSVMNHLVTIGQVDARRLIAKGYGQEVPVADNKTAKGRELNRRVEFMIVRQKAE
jgi:outer membrane protein OmpA-like peptidoglycan-associated protein